MRNQWKNWKVVLVAAAALTWAGWGVAHAVSQMQPSAEDMEMMKKMMMSRPALMKKADGSIEGYKQKAIKEGKYTCCLRHPCDFCAVHMGQCPCGKNAAADKPVCNECKGSWYAGDGAVPGKTPDQIKTLPRPLPM